MLELDRLDRKILFELDHNSRQTTSDLARKLRQGRDRVEYRLERLIEQKIVRGFTTSVNIYKLGFTLYKTYLRLENDKTRVAEFVTYLRSHPRVYWIALCDGGWDLMIAVFARNAKEFYEIHSTILSAYNEIVLNFGMYTLVEILMFRKNYLAGKGKDSFVVGGSPGSSRIDATDYEILKILSGDSRRPVVDIARTIESTAAIVKYRIERLEREGIITGYRTELDLRKLNMLFFKAQLFLRSYDLNLQARLREYCASNPYITYYIQQLGDCTIELEMEVPDYGQYNAIIEEIRSEFSRLVRNFQTAMVRRSYFNWVPRDLYLE
ncbi:MAG: winged helix-turn-helix transcriptional regulator [Bdellovibrionota bacterium]